MNDEIRLIEVKEDILADNNTVAAQLREKLLQSKTFMLNLMASPGAGKTSLILRTIDALKSDYRIGVIEADIDSIVDSETVIKHGVKAVQLRTGGFCHVDATMVSQCLDALEVDELDLIILENVGNLVCPAEFDTGATKKAMILSVPEGDDKPLKYPLMFSISDVLVINKTDAMGIFEFDIKAVKKRIQPLNPHMKMIPLSCKNGDGVDEWVHWLRREIEDIKN